MAKSPYEGKTLPELYLFASQKGIKKFFPNNEKEMIKLLDEWDSTQEPIKPAKDSPKEKKGFKDHIPLDDDLDDLIDLDDLDEDDVDASSNQNTHREDKDDESDAPKNIDVEDDTDDLLDLEDELDDEDVAEESADEPITQKGKGEPMAKKPADKKPAESKDSVEKKEPAVENNTAGMSPYSTSSAGHYAFIALKKGGLMETIVKNTDTLVAKFEVRPPSNTAQKVKIIMSEINKGKRDDKWGRFILNEKTKKVSWTSEV